MGVSAVFGDTLQKGASDVGTAAETVSLSDAVMMLWQSPVELPALMQKYFISIFIKYLTDAICYSTRADDATLVRQRQFGDLLSLVCFDSPFPEREER